jgi:hypothetical protein
MTMREQRLYKYKQIKISTDAQNCVNNIKFYV